MIWILILAVLVWLLFKFAKEQNEHIQTHIVDYGGMDVKYAVLLGFLQNTGMHITKLGRNNVELDYAKTRCLIYYIGTNLEILLITNISGLGCFEKKWVFPDGYPENKMIEEIDSYADWRLEQLKQISRNNNVGIN
ncbi:MAG: hypothetical protein LUC96_04505 [Alistipes sp.]|uniref:hypothetical protein n=1 Tax=Alistipes sp. TaxID=1872444 RepID=UPI0025BF570E|nr:hypothetical protein [Alistipes sp.]MCD8274239.1 hypothetical protein [Alistipes sp.]